MRVLRRSLAPLLVLTLLLAACASQQVPAGYEAIKTEANLLEVSKYFAGIRAGYVQARQDGIMAPEQFVLAVKADQSFVAVWNAYLEAVKAKKDTVGMWTVVVSNLGVLEGLVKTWVPDLIQKKPTLLLPQ
ncbi:MAG: hypothetical protein HY713_00725 [candidate division NC10 bacterium]|nr:hypothetical protein [candidate division NC10 bacterium]